MKRDTCRTFKKRKRDYMIAKVNKLEENIKNKNIREMYKRVSEFKKGYQPHACVIKKHDGTNNRIMRWDQFYSNLLNVNQRISFEGSEIYTAEPNIPDPSLLEVELTTERKKKCSWRSYPIQTNSSRRRQILEKK